MNINNLSVFHPLAFDNKNYYNVAPNQQQKIIIYSTEEYGCIANFEDPIIFTEFLHQMTTSVMTIASLFADARNARQKAELFTNILVPAQLPDDLKATCYRDLKKIIHIFSDLATRPDLLYQPLLLKFINCLDKKIDIIINQALSLYLEFLHHSEQGLFSIYFGKRNMIIEKMLVKYIKTHFVGEILTEYYVACSRQLLDSPWEIRDHYAEHQCPPNIIKEAECAKDSLIALLKKQTSFERIIYAMSDEILNHLRRHNDAIINSDDRQWEILFKKKYLRHFIKNNYPEMELTHFFDVDQSTGYYQEKSAAEIIITLAEKLASAEPHHCVFKITTLRENDRVMIKALQNIFWLEDKGSGKKKLPCLDTISRYKVHGPLPDAMLTYSIKNTSLDCIDSLLIPEWIGDYQRVLSDITHPSILQAAIALTNSDLAIINMQFNHGLTMLMAAILTKSEPQALALIAKPGIDVNIKDHQGNSALFLAVNQQNLTLAGKILEKRHCDVNITGHGKQPLLHVAVVNNSPAMLKLLLAHKDINVNQRDSVNNSALHLAVLGRRIDCVDALLAKTGLDVNCLDRQGWSPLHIAISNGHTTIPRLLIHDPRIEVNLMSMNQGENALFIAIKRKNLTLVNDLLAHPAIDINTTDLYGNSALMQAVAYQCDVRVLDLLLGHDDININVKNLGEESALTLAARFGDNTQLVRKLSDHNGIDINTTLRNGDTALHIAATAGHKENVGALLTNPKIFTDKPNKLGYTALTLAAKSGHTEIIVRFACDGRANVNATDNESNTPLFHAVFQRQTAAVEALLKFNEIEKRTFKKPSPFYLVNTTHKNSADLTALNVASLLRYREIVNLLIQ